MPKNDYEIKSHNNNTADFQIIDKVLSGDKSSFGELFEKYQQRIFLVFMRLTKGNVHDSEDFLQDTFILAFSKLSTFKRNAGFYTWLHRIAVNVFLMSCRRKKYYVFSIEELQECQVTDEGRIVSTLRGEVITHGDRCVFRKSEIGEPDRTLENVPNKLSVNKLMRGLPPGYKETLALRDLEGFEYKEIARILGCSLGNVKSQRHKALQKLQTLATS
ncbi:MAG: sigma-70 family RNA polymerase sigma factor [Candidatus Yanofskybacteria bacterium]|nr:sigma-70 family RNA polymerase sigma factor [Candidatus Yanofskybacteria bacterium]